MSGQRGSKICDREQLWNISHFKVKAISMSARLSSGRASGGRDRGFGAGERYLVLEIFVVRGVRTGTQARRE